MTNIITGSNANSRHIVWEARTLTPEVSHFLSSFIVKIYLGETSQLLHDLTLASREIAPLFTEWRVLNGHSFSEQVRLVTPIGTFGTQIETFTIRSFDQVEA